MIVSTDDVEKKGSHLVFMLEFLDNAVNKVVSKTIIKIFSTKMGITSGGLDFKSSSTKVEDEEVAFADNLLVETISDSSHGRFIDDSEDVPLRVIEVGRDSNDRISEKGSKIRFSSFLDFEDNHQRYCFKKLRQKN